MNILLRADCVKINGRNVKLMRLNESIVYEEANNVDVLCLEYKLGYTQGLGTTLGDGLGGKEDNQNDDTFKYGLPRIYLADDVYYYPSDSDEYAMEVTLDDGTVISDPDGDPDIDIMGIEIEHIYKVRIKLPMNTIGIRFSPYRYPGSISMMSSDFSGMLYCDTSNFTTMEYMFERCVSRTLHLWSFNTSKVTNMYHMFDNCSVDRIDLSSFDTSSVVNMAGMFHNCSVKELDVSNFNTSNVTEIDGLFNGCRYIPNLDLSNFNLNKVGNLASLFSGCNKLANVKLPSLPNGNITDIRGMFSSCSSLTSLDLSKLNGLNITYMNATFSGCSSLTSLDLSKLNAINAEDMGYMVANCPNLRNININFNNMRAKIMRNMFEGCSSLESLDLSNWVIVNATNMRYMFNGCSSLTSLDISNFDLGGTNGNPSLDDIFKGCTSLEFIRCKSINTIMLLADYLPDRTSTTKGTIEVPGADISDMNMSKFTELNWKIVTG